MQIIQSIQNRIYETRGERVMLDKDLAEQSIRARNQNLLLYISDCFILFTTFALANKIKVL